MKNGMLDAVCSAATITPDRAREVDFCRPHLEISLVVVKRQDESLRDAFNGRIGVRSGTTAESFAAKRAPGCIAKRSESNDELYELLGSGEIDAVIDDSPMTTRL
jgi:ABC-type amino acid transport substrate-binding protein